MIEVLVSSDAELDIEIAANYYESKETGLGGYFRSSIIADLTSLEFLGGTHAMKYGFHRKMCKVFPFWLYYELTSPKSVAVVAIIGQRRGDEYVRARLGNG